MSLTNIFLISAAAFFITGGLVVAGGQKIGETPRVWLDMAASTFFQILGSIVMIIAVVLAGLLLWALS